MSRPNRMNASRTLTLVALCLLAMTTTVPMATVRAADSEGPERPSVPETSDGVAAATATTDTLTITHTFERLPNRPGDVRVTVEADAPNSVSAITLRPPENASAVEATGYQRTDEGWVWERSAAPEGSTLTYVVTANRTEGGILEATSTGEWALFNWRNADVSWSYSRAADAPEPTVVSPASYSSPPRNIPSGDCSISPGRLYWTSLSQ